MGIQFQQQQLHMSFLLFSMQERCKKGSSYLSFMVDGVVTLFTIKVCTVFGSIDYDFDSSKTRS